DPELHLAIAPGPISLLCLEDLADGITDRDQLLENSDMLLRDALATPTFARDDGYRGAVQHLHQAKPVIDEEAAFANAGIFRIEVDGIAEFELQVDVDIRWLAIVEAIRKFGDGVVERGFQVDAYLRQAGIG